MQKHVNDTSAPTATYEVPRNVAALVRDIELKAKSVYPDHEWSRAMLEKQELINELSKAYEANLRAHTDSAKLRTLMDDAAADLLDWHQKLLFPL